jgi:hypothetical protein
LSKINRGITTDMNVGVKFFAVVLGGALLIYGLLLLLVWTIPSLSAAQLLPQYPAILLVWLGLCLVVTFFSRGENRN